MSFADEAEKENRGGYLGRGCGVGAMLSQLAPKLREEVETVLADRPDITTTAIRRALLKQVNGTLRVPSAYTFQRHRRQMCRCTEKGDE